MRFQQYLNAKVPHWATPRAVLPPAPSQRSPTRRHGLVLWAEEVLKSELLKDILGAISFLRQVVNSKTWRNNILHTSIYIYIHIFRVYIYIERWHKEIVWNNHFILIHHSLENVFIMMIVLLRLTRQIHKLRLHPWSLLPDDGSHQLLPLGPAFFRFFLGKKHAMRNAYSQAQPTSIIKIRYEYRCVHMTKQKHVQKYRHD